MTTTYSIVMADPTWDKTMSIRRILKGATPVNLDRSFCRTQHKLRLLSNIVKELDVPTEYAEDMKWALENAIRASSANMMFSRLRKNSRDTSRNIVDKTNLLTQLSDILDLEEV